MVFHLGQRQIFVDVLAHGECRLNVESDFGDDTESPEAYDGAAKGFSVALAGKSDYIARSGHEFESRNRGRKVAIFLAGTMRRRGAGSGDRNVRQRGQIVQSEALGIELRT